MVNTEDKIFWEGRRYFGGELGFTDDGRFVLKLYTTPPPNPRGTYFTSLPISDDRYRRTHKGRCKVAVVDHFERVAVYDDWGTRHYIVAPREVLVQLLQEAVDHDVPLSPVHEQTMLGT